MEEEIQNKVAASALVTLDLEELKPDWQITGFDMSEVLFKGLVLKEKDFRDFVARHNWSEYNNHHVHVFCSTDAIVPTWAFMIVAAALSGIAKSCLFGSESDMRLSLWRQWIQQLELSAYLDKRVVVKGCGNESIPETVYVELTAVLVPVVKALMFGEPCATVPLFKKK